MERIVVHFLDDREETYDERSGTVSLPRVPQKDEYIWFNKEVAGSTSWIVTDVATWIGSCEVAVYVKPVLRKKTKNENPSG